MKKPVKVSLIIAGILLFIGLVVCVIAWTLSNSGFGEGEWKEQNAQFDKSVVSIETDLQTLDVSVKYIDGDKILVGYYENDKTKVICKEEEGVLKVKKDGMNLSWLDFLSFGFSPNDDYGVTIGVPKDFSGELDLHATTGDVDVDGIKLKKDLSVNSTTGEIKLEDCAFENIIVANSTGETELDDVTAQDVKANSTTGNISAKNLIGKGFIGETSTGEVNLSDVELSGDMKVNTTTGNIIQNNASVKGTVTLVATTGNIELNKFLVEKEFFAQTSTGNITATMVDNGLFMQNCNTNTGHTDLPTFQGNKVPMNISSATGNILVKFA